MHHVLGGRLERAAGERPVGHVAIVRRLCVGVGVSRPTRDSRRGVTTWLVMIVIARARSRTAAFGTEYSPRQLPGDVLSPQPGTSSLEPIAGDRHGHPSLACSSARGFTGPANALTH